MRVRLLVIALVVLAACSGGAHGYGSDTEGAFMESCAVKQQQSEAVCRCTYERITQEIPFDEYVELDKQLQKDPKAVPDKVLRIVSDCGSHTDSSSSTSESSGAASDSGSDRSGSTDATNSTSSGDSNASNRTGSSSATDSNRDSAR